MNNAINDRYLINNEKEMINDQEQCPNKQSKSPQHLPENPLRHSPNGKNKRLLTKDIMSGTFFVFLIPKFFIKILLFRS